MKKIVLVLTLSMVFLLAGCNPKVEGDEFLGDWVEISKYSNPDKILITVNDKGAIKVSYIETVNDNWVNPMTLPGVKKEVQLYKEKIRTYFPSYKKGVLFFERGGTFSLSNKVLSSDNVYSRHKEFKREEKSQENQK